MENPAHAAAAEIHETYHDGPGLKYQEIGMRKIIASHYSPLLQKARNLAESVLNREGNPVHRTAVRVGLADELLALLPEEPKP